MKNRRDGFCLIEAMVALAIFATVMISFNELMIFTHKLIVRQDRKRTGVQMEQVCQRINAILKVSKLEQLAKEYLVFTNRQYGCCTLIVVRNNLVLKTQAGGQLFIAKTVRNLVFEKDLKNHRILFRITIDQSHCRGYLYYGQKS
ncbi:hypothetical protein ESZ50_03405 [Weissella muntiaci]|uniref:Prepilin-type N-terminal cleavage/methylation domain-containing protein n=1 Tax=Weissella muntiaci TaxID=2508881 RepID=A0A6C2C7X1_9LACO|nr:prepilin-type N-terminal cleavage/methylation domain-containing protein [Weissella muntiaci]TYC50111.1 hypothetical protein ESZ50_03405 [Weissella muntiaci]